MVGRDPACPRAQTWVTTAQGEDQEVAVPGRRVRGLAESLRQETACHVPPSSHAPAAERSRESPQDAVGFTRFARRLCLLRRQTTSLPLLCKRDTDPSPVDYPWESRVALGFPRASDGPGLRSPAMRSQTVLLRSPFPRRQQPGRQQRLCAGQAEGNAAHKPLPRRVNESRLL